MQSVIVWIQFSFYERNDAELAAPSSVSDLIDQVGKGALDPNFK
jgi:hypothetical protein